MLCVVFIQLVSVILNEMLLFQGYDQMSQGF